MKPDTIYIIPRGTFGDKNDNLQFYGPDDVANSIKTIVSGIGQFGEFPKFKSLNLFIQGDSRHIDCVDRWVMIEHWSTDSDLFFEFCEFVASELNLKLEIGFPSSEK